MANLNVSVAHSLQLIPIDRLSKFVRIGVCVKLAFVNHADDAQAIPGSIRITSTSEDNIIKKTISYKRRIVDHIAANLLERYKTTYFIAVYTDETGNRRTAGSPDYPLTFSYTSGDGIFSCKLEGEDTTIDMFII